MKTLIAGPAGTAASKQQNGMRGVFLVAGELAARGLIVSPTSRNAFGADLLVTDAACDKAWSVQVKTNMTTFGFWLVGERARRLRSPSHVYVLVNLRQNPGAEFYVVPSAVVAKSVVVDQRPKSTWYSVLLKDLQPYRDNWGIFGTAEKGRPKLRLK